jgi:hypothetical protein
MEEVEMKKWMIALGVIGGVLFGLAGCAPVTLVPAAPALPAFEPRPTYTPETGIEPSPLQAEVFCSPTQIRTGMARISWQASEEEIRVQQLQVTIFKQGFEQGVFGSISPLQEKQLTLSGLARERRAVTEGLQRLNAVLYSYDPKEQKVTVELSDLEPGLLYFLRLQSGDKTVGSVLKVEAPICPADIETGGD